MTLAKHPQTLAELMYGSNSQEIALGAIGQEKFCRLVAAGHTYENAYALAYNIDKNRTGCNDAALRLSRAPHIVARIMQIRAAGIRGYTVKREDLLEPLLWALNTARQNHSTDQVRKCVMDIGKLFGLVIDKVQAEISGQFTVMQDVQIDGNSLVFDVGSGKPISIKGERVDGMEPVAPLSATRAITSPDDTSDTLQGEGGTSPLDALQNTFKTLPAQPVDLDLEALPVDATLDMVGMARDTQDVVKGKRKGSKVQGAGRAVQDEGEPYCGEDML